MVNNTLDDNSEKKNDHTQKNFKETKEVKNKILKTV
jgi:hypothetical protein